jgi:hypothetical protein
MKLPQPNRACSCRDPATGRLLGKACPELENRGHGQASLAFSQSGALKSSVRSTTVDSWTS